jgi:hypothetical protein
MDNRDIEPPPVLPPARSSSIWLLVVLAAALLLALPTFLAVRWFFAGSDPASKARPNEPSIIASFRGDFRPEHPGPGWHYYWNANGPIADTNAYAELVWNGTYYATSESPIPGPPPAHYLRVSHVGGHPGHGPSQTASLGIDYEHAVIIAFGVPGPGHYLIGQSLISRNAGAKGGTVRLQIFVNDRETGPDVICRSREGAAFDRELGQLSGGDIIYVVVAPGDTDVNDTFELDFSVGRY